MDSDEDLVTYGTPLPDLEEDEVLRKRSAQDIQVRDEKGRQRFHGAFTGGFSAGYFNTVGTKEGWAPATFISTRDRSKSTRIEQNPEDFMDEEDFNEFGIAPKKIRTTSNFQDETSSSTRKRKFISNSDVAIPGEPPLRDIIKPVVESIGIIILKRMGWRQGQGIGPRVKKRTKKDVKTYGCSPGPLELEDEDPMLNRFTLAPEDTTAIPYIPKDDLHGIGYSGLSTISVLSDPSDKLSTSATKSWIAKDKKKLAISGQAFGVGAFEDDDDDIYTQDDMTQYDFSEFAGNKRDESSKNSTGSKNKSTYGVLVLEGFCIATRPKSAKQHYPPPQLPLDFRPVYKRASRFSDASSSKEKSRHKLTADERSKLLGEKKFVRADNNAGKVPEMSSKSDETHKHAPAISIRLTETCNFKPFVKDDLKQKRYEEYLKLRDNQDHFKLIQPSSMTEWEKQQEIEEFAESASLFRPMSKALSSRFESRSHLGIEHDVMRELQDLKKEKVEASPLTIKKGPIEPKRETFEWHPVSLLCRRFNVPNPYPESTCEGVPCAQKVKLSIFDCLSIGEEILKDEQSIDESETSVAKPIKEISEIKKEIEEPRVKDTITETAETDNLNTEGVAKENSRPPMDLFKDIFQNTSSEESDNSDQEKAKNSAAALSPKLDTIKQEVVELCDNENKPTTSNNLAKTPPAASTMKGAFGVFANLDLDALNKRTSVSKKTFSETREVLQKQDVAKISAPILEKEIIDVEATTSNVSLPTEDYYGPALPPSGITAVSPEASSQRVPHKHYKHKHKSKHHKHKVKKRKKEKKKHSKKDLEESSDYSVNSDEEISSSVILEKLKKLQYKERTKK